jgi:hypothetical protein
VIGAIALMIISFLHYLRGGGGPTCSRDAPVVLAAGPGPVQSFPSPSRPEAS